MPKRILKLAILAALAAALPAHAQLGLPTGGGLPGRVGGAVGGVQDLARGTVQETVETGSNALARLRQTRLADLARTHPRELDLDPAGQPAVRGEIVVLAISDSLLDAARRQGFGVARTERLDALDLTVTTLSAPDGMSLGEARRRLNRIDPSARLEFNHIYSGAGGVAATTVMSEPQTNGAANSARIGLVDTGIDVRHPVFAGATIEQRGFAPGGVTAAAHGTAVASLMVGRQGAFRGAAPGARLFAADVYGATPRGGSASAIAGALNWMGEVRPTAVNLSLVGPPNLVLQAAVSALLRKGVAVVAAVSNDGPAAPAAYPASYPGVIAVIGVDARNRPLIETGKSAHIDFAAPGADMAAASPGGGFSAVRGASFAAPIVAARLAVLTPPTADGLAASAQDRRKVFGRGLIGSDVRVAASALNAR